MINMISINNFENFENKQNGLIDEETKAKAQEFTAILNAFSTVQTSVQQNLPNAKDEKTAEGDLLNIPEINQKFDEIKPFYVNQNQENLDSDVSSIPAQQDDKQQFEDQNPVCIKPPTSREPSEIGYVTDYSQIPFTREETGIHKAKLFETQTSRLFQERVQTGVDTPPIIDSGSIKKPVDVKNSGDSPDILILDKTPKNGNTPDILITDKTPKINNSPDILITDKTPKNNGDSPDILIFDQASQANETVQNSGAQVIEDLPQNGRIFTQFSEKGHKYSSLDRFNPPVRNEQTVHLANASNENKRFNNNRFSPIEDNITLDLSEKVSNKGEVLNGKSVNAQQLSAEINQTGEFESFEFVVKNEKVLNDVSNSEVKNPVSFESIEASLPNDFIIKAAPDGKREFVSEKVNILEIKDLTNEKTPDLDVKKNFDSQTLNKSGEFPAENRIPGNAAKNSNNEFIKILNEESNPIPNENQASKDIQFSATKPEINAAQQFINFSPKKNSDKKEDSMTEPFEKISTDQIFDKEVFIDAKSSVVNQPNEISAKNTEGLESKTVLTNNNSAISAAENQTEIVFEKKEKSAESNEKFDGINFEKFLNQVSKESEINADSAKILNREFELSEQIKPKIVELAAFVEQNGEKKTIKLKLNPEELGEIEIRIEKESSGKIHATIQTETESAREILVESLDKLRDSLQNSGLDVERLEVSQNLLTSNGNENRENGSRHFESGENAGGNAYGFDGNVETEDEKQENPADRLVSLHA